MNRLWVWPAVVIVLLSFIFALPVSAKVVYVKTDGNDANDGSSWELAKQTVQAGLNASSGATNDEVRVAQGTYVERITLTIGVALYGGYVGVGDIRDPKTYVTILDGNQGGSVVTSPSSATVSTKIDGFTIRNGTGTLRNNYYYGGGIYCYSSSPTISNNTISCNSVDLVNAGYGGGIYCYSSSSTIANNTITDNSASVQGGGIYCNSSSPAITNNTISANSANGGGGIYCYSSSPTIVNNIIAGNNGGGLYCFYGFSPTISNNTISGNTIPINSSGGAGGIFSYSSSPIISNNTISGNSADSGAGGIICYGSSPRISNNTILSNIAGSLYCGGIDCRNSTTPTISNNIVAFNSSGICNSSSTPVLQNNCVYGNTAYNYSGLLAGTGDLSLDPKLADCQYGNVHIQPDSPCTDAGEDSIVQPGWVDMDSQTRIQGVHVDIGADESDGTIWPAGPCAIVRVSLYGNDANDGSSWALAKRTVQSGINLTCWKGGEVWVAAGTYNERIILHPFVYVYGGFAGTETARSERNWVSNRTILDGNAGGSVVIAMGIGDGLSSIDGFTIRNGIGIDVWGGGANNFNGGGIYCYSSSLKISNNTITSNSASAAGGGIYCYFSSPAISNNKILGNTASFFGGGIYCSSSSPTISNNTIINNISEGGGGIYCDFSSPTITNNTLTGNSASDGGGICCYSSSPKISSSIVAFNSSGIWRSGGTPVLRNNCAFGNTAYNYSGLSAGTGSISVDPKFVNRTGGNYHLQPISPCINAGWNNALGLLSLDMDSEVRICQGIVDIGADEYWPSLNITGIKNSADGTVIIEGLAIVSAVFDDCFYIETADRSSGIQVVNLEHTLAVGMKAGVQGVVRTNTDGERYIDASAATANGMGTVEPVSLTNKSLGGGDWNFDPLTGAGQRGIEDGTGLNNIGLLVKTTGVVTAAGDGFFYIDDGTHARDASIFNGVRVRCESLATPIAGQQVTITGISTIKNIGGRYFRSIRPRIQSDIQILQ